MTKPRVDVIVAEIIDTIIEFFKAFSKFCSFNTEYKNSNVKPWSPINALIKIIRIGQIKKSPKNTKSKINNKLFLKAVALLSINGHHFRPRL